MTVLATDGFFLVQASTICLLFIFEMKRFACVVMQHGGSNICYMLLIGERLCLNTTPCK